MTAETVWRIMHLRWDIENSLFNGLKQNWAFELADLFIMDFWHCALT